MRLLKLAPIGAFATLVAADFHIFNCYHGYGVGDQSGLDADAVTVPSNQYSCDGARSNPLVQGISPSWVNPGTSYFYVQGLCGMDQLDFYWNGGAYDIYAAGGDGSVIGNCYQGSGSEMTCPAAFDQLTSSAKHRNYEPSWRS
ncbi:hypothetical protein EIP91_010928 [Steccherinum ochraceum]|uniref:Uncharacterized protein n=1 Tax=Steccherinum ochraceum TaxID=92696 RepID=A0A4R0R038_9APHY|nr:hypothetical protein EIP91_010928 [Steccherinum ochraceum]